MDDVWVWLRAIRLGWRWVDGNMVYKSSWRMEEMESGVNHLEKTSEILEKMEQQEQKDG